MAVDIKTISNPEYKVMLPFWEKYRYTFEGGKDFVNRYLIKFSIRESDADFEERKRITYCPAFAKAAVVDVKNAIFQRMADIKRSGGAESWLKAINGEDNGVDLQGNTMTGYIGRVILPELLSIGKVGVYIDKPRIENTRLTLRESSRIRPYLYMYKAEEILAWTYNNYNQLKAVLLLDVVDDIDEETQLIIGVKNNYRLLRLTDQGVYVTFYDEKGVIYDEVLLNLTEIPFEILEINASLMVDTADYQIAHLNMASSDVNYALKANFPFYTEQYNTAAELSQYIRDAHENRTTVSETESQPTPGTGANAQIAKDKSIKVGVTQGRRYPQGTDRPGFINPSPEPLRVSMEKQEKLKEEIRQLTNLAITNISPTRSSAESKAADEKSLEAGLSYIGLELEYTERRIALIWGMYERTKNIATVKYPTNYSLKTDDERLGEAKQYSERMDAVPSTTYKKEIAKQVAEITLGNKISDESLTKINKEIEAAKVINTNHEIIRSDFEAGFVSTESASQILGYPQGEVEQAKKDHAERLARIAISQSSNADLTNPAARGVEDMDDNTNSGVTERQDSMNTDQDDSPADKSRGEGK